jgi:ceramide glucosyltransferase
MEAFSSFLQWFFIIPAAGGAVYGVLCLLAVWRFCARRAPCAGSFSSWPPVTVLKPVCGLEKNQESNLASACLQDYPDFQVVYSVQDPGDPAIPILEEIRRKYPQRATLVVEDRRAGPNGKVNNLLGGLAHARHDILVISDSDVYLRADYLKNIVGPLADPGVGYACTLYRAGSAGRWFEKMELLTLNADFVPGVIFAYVTGASAFCLGSSVALRRDSLRETGGLETLADYLAEDYVMGKRILDAGNKMVLVPYFVDLTVDLEGVKPWWNYQVSWDQKTRSARPAAFFATILTRSVPFAFLFAAARGADVPGLAVLAAALGIRLVTAAVILALFRDREGLKSLGLLPLRDMAGLATWLLAFTKKSVIWRGSKLILNRGGRLAREASR